MLHNTTGSYASPVHRQITTILASATTVVALARMTVVALARMAMMMLAKMAVVVQTRMAVMVVAKDGCDGDGIIKRWL